MGMRVQTTLAFAPLRRASEGDGALRSATIQEPAPPLSRKRESDSLLVAPASKKFAVPRRTTGNNSVDTPVVSEGERTEPVTPHLKEEPQKRSSNLSCFLQWYVAPESVRFERERDQLWGVLFLLWDLCSGAYGAYITN